MPIIIGNMADKVFVHLQPARRDLADFIIGMRCESAIAGECEWEQLWAKKLSINSFKICCIPFFCYGLALGDIVETASDTACGRDYMVTSVVEKSGNFTLRIMFSRECAEDLRLGIIKELRLSGCILEWYSEYLLGVSLHSLELLSHTRDTLDELRQQAVIEYETGWKGEASIGIG